MASQSNSKEKSSFSASFTLVELLITIGIIAVLLTVIVFSLNPGELLKQTRDARRISDLSSLNRAISYYLATELINPYLGEPNTIYLSLPDTSSSCANLGLPPPPSGWQYHCVTQENLRKVDGNGWIPINFASLSSGSFLPALPIDPINSTTTGNYYTYVTGGSYALSALLESKKETTSRARNDGGYDPERLELGDNLLLWRDASGLVGYWTFDEGSGTTAYDRSGYNNHGTLYNGPTWQSESNCKVGKCLSFDGVNDYIVVPYSSSLNTQTAFSISLWVKNKMEVSTFNTFFAVRYAGPLYYWHLGFHTNNDMILYIYNDSQGFNLITVTNAIPNDNKYYFVTAQAVANQKIEIYINGELKNSANCSLSTFGNQTRDLRFARLGWWASDSYYFKGDLDEIRIYNRALSEAEIKAIYNATK